MVPVVASEPIAVVVAVEPHGKPAGAEVIKKIKRRSGHRFFENSYTFSSGQSLSKGLAFYGSQRGQGYFPASIASSLVSKIMAEVSSSTILQSMR